MIQSEILQTHTAWLLRSTPVTAACSAPLVLDTESSPTPRAIHEADSTGQVSIALASAHFVLLLRRVSPHPLSPLLSCLGQLSPALDSRSSPISLAEQGASALEQECEEPRLS